MPDYLRLLDYHLSNIPKTEYKDFKGWLECVKCILVEEHGFSSGVLLDAEAWEAYYLDGYTPMDAVEQDMSYA